jgi:hypothetical protein
MKNPFRLWMTGGIAVLVAAVGGLRGDGDDERLTLARISRYGMAETVQRIEASAQRHGMHVLVCLPQARPDAAGDARCVLVLESTQGGTPVVMEREGARPDLLLSVTLQRRRTGGTEVFVHEGLTGDLPEGLSAALRHDLADLPRVLEEALTA